MRKRGHGWVALAALIAAVLIAQAAVLPAEALTTSGGGKRPESSQTQEQPNDGDSVQGNGGDQLPVWGGDILEGEDSGDEDEAGVVTYTDILPWGIAAMNTGEELDEDEIEDLNDSLDYTNMGFCMATYSRPEEIDWHQVFYNGAGIETVPDEDLLEAYLEMVGRDELFGDLEVLKTEDIEKFVKENTGTDYQVAQKSLYYSNSWTYLQDYDAWCWEHGDTNLYPIEFLAGTREDDVYHLLYAGYDSGNYTQRNFVLTVKIGRNGKRTYLSNLPADAPAPRALAEIEFYQEKDEALDALDSEPEDIIEVEVKDSDEPMNWYWTVVTANEDIWLSVERMDLDKDGRMALGWVGAFVSDEWVRQLQLKKGESVLLYVNMPWNPNVRVSAWAEDFYGDYLFGSDNWLHLEDPDTGIPYARSIVGHDMDAEGWGVNPNSRSDLIGMLKGSWIWFNPETGEPEAALMFDDYGYLSVEVLNDPESFDYYGDFWVEYSHLYTGENDAPDYLKVHAYGDARETLPDTSKYSSEDDGIGDYLVYAEQSIGAQKLILRQANNGFAFMSDILPGAEEETEFTFYRYRGAKTWKSAYKDKLKEAIRAMTMEVEGEEDWEHYQRQVDYYFLYDIEKNGVPELMIRRGASEAGATLQILTFDGQDAITCKTESGDDRIGAGHMGFYTIPGENGVLLWNGHMGWSEMNKLTLEYVDLSAEFLFSEDLNEKLQEDPKAEYTRPGEVVPGSVELSLFYPQSLLPIDYYEFWSELSGEFDPTSPALPTALDKADPYGAWIIRMATGDTEEAEDDIPDWMEEAIEMNSWINVCPIDSYMNDPGSMHYDELFGDGVLYPYTGGELHDTHWYEADLDGDGIEEAIAYLAEENNDGDSYRVIFRLEGHNSITAYTAVNWSWGKSRVTEGGKLESADYPDSFRPKMVLMRRNDAFEYGTY